MLVYLVEWWNQEVAGNEDKLTDAEHADILVDEDGLEEHITKETLAILDDGNMALQGAPERYHTLQMTWAENHRCLDHPDCQIGLIMDGNSDVVAKIKSSRKSSKAEASAAQPERGPTGGGSSSSSSRAT